MDRSNRAVILYKRWHLRQGALLNDIVRLVRERIVPHYRTLSVEVVLELHAQGTTAVLAVQRWPSRSALEAAMGGPEFQNWWHNYQPILEEWNALVEFDDEWETEDILS